MDISEYLQQYDKVTKKGACRACGNLVPWSRVNLSSHKRASCPNASAEEKEIFRIQPQATSGSPHANISDPQVNPVNVSADDTTSQPYELTEGKKTEIDTAFGNFCYRTGIPFAVVKSESFRDLVKLLNPAYGEVMPKPRTISGKLLDEQYDRSFGKLKDILNNCTDLSLITDGWTNTRGDHIVNYMINAPSHQTVFYKSSDTSGITQDDEGIAFAIIAVLVELGVEKFSAVITDHAPVMKSAWKIIEEKHPHISAFGCAAHGVNLLIKNILEPYKEDGALY